MKQKKGGIHLNGYSRKKRRLTDSRSRFAPKIEYKISQAILELLDDYNNDYDAGISVERIPNKIRDSLPIYPVMRKADIVRYTKASLLNLKSSGLVEQFQYGYHTKSIYVRLKKNEGK